ncbi:MAG: hypothetical protein WD609_15940 [Aquisalimonadaceae bacterium]
MSDPRRQRLLIAATMGLGLTAVYILGLYLFFTALWPVLPDWTKAIAFVLLAVFAIGSPIAALARISRVPQHHGTSDQRRGKR